MKKNQQQKNEEEKNIAHKTSNREVKIDSNIKTKTTVTSVVSGARSCRAAWRTPSAPPRWRPAAAARTAGWSPGRLPKKMHTWVFDNRDKFACKITFG